MKKHIMALILSLISEVIFAQIQFDKNIGIISIVLDDNNDIIQSEIEMNMEKISSGDYPILELGGNFTTIPDYIFDLDSVSEMIVNNNKKLFIGKQINKMNNLQSLRVIGCLKKISDDVSLPNLTSLVITCSKIKKIPDFLFDAENLNYLKITNSKIKYIPNSLNNLSKLEGLILHDNRIKELPSVQGLVNINVIALMGNRLRYLPEDICELKKLKELYLDSNVTINECLKSIVIHYDNR